MSDFHTSVMLQEVLEYLDIKPGQWYVDCNLGGGGHTAGILAKGGKVIGIDLDPEAIAEVKRTQQKKENLILFQGNFTQIDKAVGDRKIAGIIFDLGVSSYQFEAAERGFSFNQDAPLDMRMDKTAQQATAADLVNGLHEGELTELFLKLGEESFAKPIARAICIKRKTGRIETTLQLTKIVESVKHREGKTHPATKVFQALRIAVNDELNNLKEALPKAWQVLSPGGRLVVISFHSLEDRIVKEFMKKEVTGESLTKKPLGPTPKEAEINPRSRSSKLRVLAKRA